MMQTERGSRLFSFTDSTSSESDMLSISGVLCIGTTTGTGLGFAMTVLSSESDMHALAPLKGTTPIPALELCNVALAVAVS